MESRLKKLYGGVKVACRVGLVTGGRFEVNCVRVGLFRGKGDVWANGSVADWKSAIRQIENLRYRFQKRGRSYPTRAGYTNPCREVGLMALKLAC